MAAVLAAAGPQDYDVLGRRSGATRSAAAIVARIVTIVVPAASTLDRVLHTPGRILERTAQDRRDDCELLDGCAEARCRGGDIVAQARRTLDNLRLVVEAAGGTLEDVVSVTVYLADDDDWAAFDGVYREYFRPPFPARAVVGAGLRGVLVEVSAVARLRTPEVPAA